MKNKQINSITESLFYSAFDDVKDKLFNEAAHTIVFMVIAFEFRSKLIDHILLELKNLKIEFKISFFTEIFHRISWANSILKDPVFSDDVKTDQKARLINFETLILDHLLIEAEEYKKQGQYIEYIEFLKLSLNLDIIPINILEYLANVFYKIDDISYSLMALDKLKEASDKYHDYYISIASAYLESKQPEKAEIILARLCELEPNSEYYLFLLGEVYLINRKYEQAEIVFTKASELNPNDNKIIDRLFLIYAKTDKIYKMINYREHLEKEYGQYLKNPKGLNAISQFLMEQKRYDEAADYLEKAHKLDPNSVSINNNLGAAYVHIKKFNKAEKHLQKATEIDPDNPLIKANIGHLYLETKRFKEAKVLLDEANLLLPNHLNILNNLGCLNMAIGKPHKATYYLEKAHNLSPENSYICCNLSIAHYNVGKNDSASHYIELAYQLDPDDPYIQYNRDVYYKIHRGELMPLYFH